MAQELETFQSDTPVEVEVLPDPSRSEITSDGPLDSVQTAVMTMSPELLEELWRPEYLERLARAYWRHINKLSLGALRVVYGEHSRAVVLFHPRLELLRFHEPQYETGADFGRVTWPIDQGVLVAKRGRGQGELQIAVRRLHEGPEGRIEVAAKVANFYPWLRGGGWFARFGRFFYAQTQLRIHVIVTKGFLRSLQKLELPELRPERRDAYELPPGAAGGSPDSPDSPKDDGPETDPPGGQA